MCASYSHNSQKMLTEYTEIRKATALSAGELVRKKSHVLMREIATSVPYTPPKKKSKSKQMKLKQCYNRDKYNWQKYLITSCEFSASMNKHMYQPPKYKKLFEDVELSHAISCQHCFLRPCVIEGNRLAMEQGLRSVWEYPPLAMRNVMCETIGFMQEKCGVMFMKRMGFSRDRVPKCVRSSIVHMMDHAVVEMNGTLRQEREHSSSEDIPDYILDVNAEYHRQSLELALDEMRGKLSGDDVLASSDKYEKQAIQNMDAMVWKHRQYQKGKATGEL